MQGFDLAGGDVALNMARAGDLPDAPMVMPKQRLERSRQGVAGLVGRLLGWPVAAGDVRRSGR